MEGRRELGGGVEEGRWVIERRKGGGGECGERRRSVREEESVVRGGV